MDVLTPPRPTRTPPPPEHDPLEALIEEARRRAHRRRRRNIGAALLALGAAAGVLFGVIERGGAGDAQTQHHARSPQIAIGPRATANGPLTLADVETISPGEGPPGWYTVSTLGTDARLHTFVRCPDDVDWCGEVESVAWSPDGVWLALGVSSFGRANPYNGLHLINPATGDDRTIRFCRVADECDWFDIAWSADGSKLAYVSNNEMFVVDTDGASRRVLVADPLTRARSPSWSPDGQRLAFASLANGHSTVYVTRADGTDRRLLVMDGSAPAWSPDGTKIAYRTSCGIKLVTPDGADVTPPTESSCHAIGFSGRPVWSPDGTRIAFAATTTYGTGAPVGGTFVMAADGTDLVRVTPKTQGVYFGYDARPSWRPVPR